MGVCVTMLHEWQLGKNEGLYSCRVTYGILTALAACAQV
jgi:hypothetical protein